MRRCEYCGRIVEKVGRCGVCKNCCLAMLCVCSNVCDVGKEIREEILKNLIRRWKDERTEKSKDEDKRGYGD